MKVRALLTALQVGSLMHKSWLSADGGRSKGSMRRVTANVLAHALTLTYPHGLMRTPLELIVHR